MSSRKKVTETSTSTLPAPSSNHRRPRIGAHLSIAGGFHLACQHAQVVDADALQIFVKNQRQWQAGPIQPRDAEAFRQAAASAGIGPVVAHAAYLINLAAPDNAVRRRSIAAMVDELNRCDALGVAALVVHPGAHLDRTLESGIASVAASLNEIIDRTPEANARILLETTAGQGSAIGHRFEHLRDILAGTERRKRCGVCLDTCHLFAAGYDFRGETNYAEIMAELDRVIGVALIGCVHMNDSKRELGSRVDRREHIGKGCIGETAFGHFLNDPRLVDVPFILETPKGADGRGTDLDKVNIRRLRSMVR